MRRHTQQTQRRWNKVTRKHKTAVTLGVLVTLFTVLWHSSDDFATAVNTTAALAAAWLAQRAAASSNEAIRETKYIREREQLRDIGQTLAELRSEFGLFSQDPGRLSKITSLQRRLQIEILGTNLRKARQLVHIEHPEQVSGDEFTYQQARLNHMKHDVDEAIRELEQGIRFTRGTN